MIELPEKTNQHSFSEKSLIRIHIHMKVMKPRPT